MEPNTWACNACTFVNDVSDAVACAMCGTPRSFVREEKASALEGAVSHFVRVTGVAAHDVARRYLRTSTCLETAIERYFEDVDRAHQSKSNQQDLTSSDSSSKHAPVSCESLGDLSMQKVWAAEQHAMSHTAHGGMDPCTAAVAKAGGIQNEGKTSSIVILFIHFHHILNEEKRMALQDWAHELDLGGRSR